MNDSRNISGLAGIPRLRVPTAPGRPVPNDEWRGGRLKSRALLPAIVAGALLVAVLAQPAAAQFPPAPGTGPGLAETVEAIDSARVTTRILYITAHPDDESSSVLTYLARGLHAEVALLSITRGEGGQNALGPEQAPQLGLIRTQELLAATRGYGVKLYFTRAKDFGYSKTPEETERIWGEQVLDDMVRVIRTFRPHIVINNWGGVHSGHGHHQAAGLLTPKAVQMAADAKAFPAQLQEGLGPWGGASHPVEILGLERGTENPEGYLLPLDDIAALWGKSWREIGLDAFVNHRTQGIAGFLGSPYLRRPIALTREDSGKVDAAQLSSPLEKFASIERVDGESIQIADQSLARARDAALRLDWISASRALVSAAKQIEVRRKAAEGASGPEEFRVREELAAIEERIQKALAMVAGAEVTAQADKSELVAGESFTVSASARCRKEAGCTLGELRLVLPDGMKEIKREGEASKGFSVTVAAEKAPPMRPWDELQPEPPPLVVARQTATVAGYTFAVSAPVIHIQASSTRVDKVPLRIVPVLTLAVEPKQAIALLGKAQKPFDAVVRVHSYAAQASEVTVGVDVPAGWTASAPQPLAFSASGDQYVHFSVTLPEKLAAGSYALSAYAKRGEERFTTSVERLPSLPTQLWSEPAQCTVHAFDVKVPEGLRVGYVTAENEPIPEALSRLGIRVEMLDAAALAFGDLSRFDAVVVGVRAYELRQDLAPANARLLRYVERGGTLVVQYNRDYVWDKLQPAPYPAKIGNPTPRITDENSPVRFLRPEDPLLSAPNRIKAEDFRGWVQERGLYFWSQFDPRYTPLLAMNDPNEAELTGGLAYARYGKGTYIYTGLAFFRQLPEGIPGAYRLFVNLLSASRSR